MDENKTSDYDVPVFGIKEGNFESMHVPAVVCISFSLVSNILVIVILLTRKKLRKFFTWTKSERCLVYMVISDSLFNVVHFPDHLQVLLTQDHVRPNELCVFYGIMVYEFIAAQIFLSNVVAINAFVLVYFQVKLNFGLYDFKVLLIVYGVPAVCGLVTTATYMMGTNGAFCYFDALRGRVAYLILSTIPLLVVYVANILLYVFTWIKLRKEEPKFKSENGSKANIIKASHVAARNMSLFVTGFFIQWSSVVVYGILQNTGYHVPQFLTHLGTALPNLGGVLNIIIYIVIQRRRYLSGSNNNKIKSTGVKITRRRSMPIVSVHQDNGMQPQQRKYSS